MYFRGLKTATDSGMRTAFGSVYAILGDHPSQAEFAGVLGNGNCCCRYCFKHKDLFTITEWPAHVNGKVCHQPAERENFGVFEAHAQLVREAAHGERGEKGPAKKGLKIRGWSPKVSPFWDLVWMRSSFYQCFAICLLHNIFLGLAKRQLQYTCIKNDIEEELNVAWKNFDTFPGKQSFSSRFQLVRRN